MTQQDFRDYIKFLSRCIPYYEKGFLLELKRVWLIKSFWKERIFELMRDDIAFSKLAIELVRKALPSYKLNGIDGLKYHLKDTYQVSGIHYALLKMLEEDCRKLDIASKFFNSHSTKRVDNNGKKKDTIDAELVFNFVDTDLSYEDWIKEVKIYEFLNTKEKGDLYE